MREVGLVEEVVGTEELDRLPGGLALEPEAAEDLALEVLAGQQVVLGVFERDTAVAPLPVQGGQGVREPADAALDRDEVQPREAVADPGADDGRDGPGVAHEEGDPDRGVVRVHPVTGEVLLDQREIT